MAHKYAVARPISVSNSHTILGWISSNGYGGDSIEYRRTDRGVHNIPVAILKRVVIISHTLSDDVINVTP